MKLNRTLMFKCNAPKIRINFYEIPLLKIPKQDKAVYFQNEAVSKVLAVDSRNKTFLVEQWRDSLITISAGGNSIFYPQRGLRKNFQILLAGIALTKSIYCIFIGFKCMVFKWVLITFLKVYLVSLPVAWKAFVRYLYIYIVTACQVTRLNQSYNFKSINNWLDV